MISLPDLLPRVHPCAKDELAPLSNVSGATVVILVDEAHDAPPLIKAGESFPDHGRFRTFAT